MEAAEARLRPQPVSTAWSASPGGIGVLVSVMLAATAGGADWGARTMGLLLSWEPRRTRVFLVRLGVLLVIALAVEAMLVAARRRPRVA